MTQGQTVRAVVVIVVLVLVAAVVVYLLRRREAARGQAPRRDPLADHRDVDFARLAVGAVVTIDGSDHVVRGTLRFEQDGYTWAEHLLDDVHHRRWLSVEDDEGLKLALWDGVPQADVTTGGPGDREIVVGGTAYRLEERGEAGFTAEGTTGTAPSGRAEYADYRADGGRLAAFERFGGGGWEAAVGRTVSPGELTVYAAPRD